MPFDSDNEKARLEAVSREYAQEVESTTERQANQYAARQATAEVEGPDILVLGAATGAWAPTLIERFGRFDTVDAVPSLVDDLRAIHSEVTGFVSLFEEFTPQKSYDTVIMGHVLEHLYDPVGVLRRASGWLKAGGRIVILVPNAESLHRLVGVELGSLQTPSSFSAGDKALGHRRVYTASTLRDHVEDAGLRVAKAGGLILKPLSNRQMDDWSDDLRSAYFALGAGSPEMACVLLCVAESRAE